MLNPARPVRPVRHAKVSSTMAQERLRVSPSRVTVGGPVRVAFVNQSENLVMSRIWSLSLVVQIVMPLTVIAQEIASPTQDEAAIRETVDAYVEAYNRRDAQALAAYWSPDAVYTSRTNGEQVVGRAAIEKEFTASFDQTTGAKLDVSVESIQFISPNVAVEHGTARVVSPDESPAESSYTAVYVKRDGQWLLDRVTEDDVPVATSHYQQLKELEWMIGQWADEDENTSVVTQCQWARNNNFIIRAFTITLEGQTELAGMQIIGWDAAAKRIRSWVFDSDGGFSEGVWTRKDDRWFIRKSGILPDGGTASAVNIIKYVDDNTCTLQSVSRSVDGEILPNVDEVTIVKQTTE